MGGIRKFNPTLAEFLNDLQINLLLDVHIPNIVAGEDIIDHVEAETVLAETTKVGTVKFGIGKAIDNIGENLGNLFDKRGIGFDSSRLW